jgi:hypothetical protein
VDVLSCVQSSGSIVAREISGVNSATVSCMAFLLGVHELD